MGLWRRLGLALAGGLLLLVVTPPAVAHVRSESHSVWEIDGSEVDLVLTIPNREADRVSKDGTAPSDDRLKSYLAARIYPIGDDKRCALVPPIETLAAANGFRKYDFTFQCASAGTISVHSGAFFDLVKNHTNFAQIQNAATGDFAEQLITNEHQTVEVSGGEGSRLKTASFLEFVQMGILHIFTGVDHMSFLLGLVLISRRLKDLVFVVTGFTIGHSLTLALAVTGVIRPHAEYIDALVALTIALIGAENIAVSTGKSGVIAVWALIGAAVMIGLQFVGIGELPTLLVLGAALFTANYLMISGHLADAGRLRLVITLVFGLIHGFGFAASLLELQLPTERLAELLVGFNIGVEVGQLTLVAGVSLLVMALARLRLSLPRPIVVEVCGSFLVGLGIFWFVSRSYA